MKETLLILSLLQLVCVLVNAKTTGGPSTLGEYLLFLILIALPTCWLCGFLYGVPERRPNTSQDQ